jgi:hypothetical protein
MLLRLIIRSQVMIIVLRIYRQFVNDATLVRVLEKGTKLRLG